MQALNHSPERSPQLSTGIRGYIVPIDAANRTGLFDANWRSTPANQRSSISEAETLIECPKVCKRDDIKIMLLDNFKLDTTT